ncbi:ribose-phosphate diphosphokinase [Treponema socranskii subsp. socranskii VPI DR56BR1116 = ATCC 35536]|uniref:ribose-phosphate diphosphokinase n=1 Tax=Treponema socranskii subsp. socranskii VPI DR56BR1116 = ATCC 35536 TaxID=1125725 RepID=U1GRL8_TRESO|nr:ribose-phosphate diphosphokinase [Treponema socranskii]ERF60615.1 ribose-phosphate diphosphokinase [Treponema socranskii subsp. socranskii VPI DR56BR1116 = ATCC 35536]ERK03188.1 ribose-phosphate diphosphokinase [Treponema socranskii subsp. socranskii VPI DR56BR1116 = ATCC 35536]
MPYSEPMNLAVVACPGGERFADEVITHLKHMYKHRFTLKNDVISKRYELNKDDLVKKINFENDIDAPELYIKGDVTKYRAPSFKIPARFTFFANGEFKTELLESIRGKDVYIFQDIENHEELSLNDGTNKAVLSVNDHVMSMLVTIDAVRQAGSAAITLVVPAYPYSRQHKKKGREGLTASMLGHIYEWLGVTRIITLDIHSREIVNAFSSVNLENLHASYQIIRELSKIVDLTGETEDLVVVSPDTGAIDRNKFYAVGLKLPLAMIYKERDYSIVTQNAKNTNIKSIKLLGDVHGKVAFLADDMLGTGGTLLKAMGFLKEQGATKVIAAISLPFFTGNAIDLFDEAYRQGLFYRIIGTNAVYHEALCKREWYINTSVSGLFANVIMRVHYNQSLSRLLENRTLIEKMEKQTQPLQPKT